MSNTTSAVRMESGQGGLPRPMLYINNEPQSGLSYMTYRPDAGPIKQFSDAGCPLFFFSLTPDDCMYEFAERVWVGPEQYDYSEVDARLKLFAEQAPDAYFIPRIYMTSPPWWDDAHPEELVVFDDGTRAKPPHIPTAKKETYPSLASEVWRKDTIENLKRLIRYIEDGPYGDRIAGYHVASQHTEEWFAYWVYQDYLGDYSAPALREWRRWLRKRYGNNDALRAAWGRPDATLDEAPIPSGEERKAHYRAEFRQLPEEQPSVDYAIFFSDLMADTMLLFARAAKEACGRKKVVGAFYGYVLQFAEHAPISGHLALQRAFSSPDLDFFTSPSAYINQRLGTGYAFFMSLPETVRAHGKLWFDENDIYTSIQLARNNMLTENRYNVHGSWESWMIERRELANALSHGMAMWWFDMTARWYDGEGHMEEIAMALKFGDHLRNRSLESIAEVLLVVDAESMACQGYRTLLGPCLSNLVVELGHLGAPFDIIETHDLERVLNKRHKMILFPNLWKADAVKRSLISNNLRDSQAAAVWFHAPCLVPEPEEYHIPPEKRSSLLTGFRISHAGLEPVWPGIKTVKPMPQDGGISFVRCWRDRIQREPLTEDSCPRIISSEAKMTPLIAEPVKVDGGEMIILAKDNSGQVGLAVRTVNGWTSVFVSAPILTASWLRALADAAGVHLYLETGDTVYANKDFICVAADLKSGKRMIQFPGPMALRDVFTGDSEGTHLTELSVDLKAKEVLLLERI